jgi:ribosome-associated toxin RatA of RatAB toxin-antitoxin module
MEYEFASRAVGKLLEPLFAMIADTMVDAFCRRADEIHPG